MLDSMRNSVMNRRRFLTSSALTVGSIAGAGTLLQACNTSSTPTTTTSSGGASVTKLTVMYASGEFTKDYIAEFEKLNPDIKITFIENDPTRLNAMLAAGTPPDFVRGSAVGSANGNARGLALNLDPYLAKSTVLKKEDLLGINDSFRWDGTKSGSGPYYGIAKDWSQDATLWYNGALFDKAGIPHLSATDPISYDQLLEISKKLTTKQGNTTQVYGFGVEWAWNLWAPIATMLLQQGGSMYNADLTQTDMTTPEAKKAIQWYVDFAQAGVGPTSLNPLPDGSDESTFAANRMAISQDGFWYGGNFVKSSTDFQTAVRMAPAPIMGSKRVSPSYAGQGAWIPAASKNKDAAWKLMEYFMTGTPAHDRAKSGWGLPSLKSLMSEVPQDLPYQKAAYQTTQNELTYVGLLPDSPYVTVASWNTILDKYIQQAIKKQITVDAASQQITTEVNAALKQGKQQLS
ncbi:MAG TPA: sugar ABC transporter substrate-binding protein [Ktedonosporobacter sp.]|nr:sugar ABC transporter substrate-binding protein [Ktedonosporobacter sp.]